MERDFLLLPAVSQEKEVEDKSPQLDIVRKRRENLAWVLTNPHSIQMKKKTFKNMSSTKMHYTYLLKSHLSDTQLDLLVLGFLHYKKVQSLKLVYLFGDRVYLLTVWELR